MFMEKQKKKKYDEKAQVLDFWNKEKEVTDTLKAKKMNKV